MVIHTKNDVTSFLEDREGNIWVATYGGVDRFRAYAIPTITTKQGLSGLAWSILASKDGTVWIATNSALNHWENGQISLFGGRGGTHGSVGKLNGSAPHALFQDRSGRIWVATDREFGYLQDDGFIPIRGLPGGAVHSIAEVPSGHLWVANQQAGLFHLFEGKVLQQIPWAGLGHKDFAKVLVADPSQRGLWIGFIRSGVGYFADGTIRKSYLAVNAVGEGQVTDLRFGSRGALWVATDAGLSRIKDGHVNTLTTRNGLPCDKVVVTIEDNDHSMWLYLGCGLARIARAELDAWVADPSKVVHVEAFETSEGVRSHTMAGGIEPLMTKSIDGKIWFLPWDGVSVIDPQRLSFNKLPPPVHIEQIIADRKTYNVTPDSNGQVPLPARIRDLQIDYTALSLVAPEKVLFRYKLEGWDRDWQDAGTRRQAFYSNLPPRKYTFHVKACNNSGVWNEAGTSLAFSVAPAYYQTWWFRSLCVAAFLALLFAAYRLRLQQVEQQFNMRMEGRVAERTRIARDLHDTLLQSFQGVLLKFHAVTYMLVEHPEAQKRLEDVIDQARQAITEGRDAVQGLRSSTVVTNDLARAISMLGEELKTHHSGDHCPDFCVQVEGSSRDLAPILRDDLYRIAGEAARNAFRHAQAARIEVEIRYEPRYLRLRIRDDGKGIDPQVLAAGERAGHYGLPGLHERANLIGGKLAVWSVLDSGTEIELTVPASIAYAKSSVARRSTFSQKRA